jgi:HEAT repeats
MNLWRLSLVLVTAGALAWPASAGILFSKKTKPNPAERVPELIVIVKTDKDESKRVSAAEELRQYDPAANRDIVPVLIDVMLSDPKPSVRSEAADSLGKIRPVSQEAGWALEQAQDKDASWRVRTKARYVLMSYHWAGYHSDPKMKDGPMIVSPKDQPMGNGKVVMPAPNSKGTPGTMIVTPAPSKSTGTASPSVAGQTPPPPLADPIVKPAPSQAPRPLPQGPAQPITPATKVTPAPAPMPLPPVPTPAPAPAPKNEPSGLPSIPLPGDGPSLNGPGE